MSVLNIDPSTYIVADESSLRGILLSLSQSIAKCCDAFRWYLFTDEFIYYNFFQRLGSFRYVFTGFMAIIAIMDIYGLTRRKRCGSVVLMALAFLVLLIACGLSMLFALRTGANIGEKSPKRVGRY